MSEQDDNQYAADMARAAAEGRGRLISGVFAAGEADVAQHGTCYHRTSGYMVDPDARTVTCKGCKAQIDAFTVLLEYATEERTWKQWRSESTKEAKKLADAHEELLRVKARTRSHSRKDAEAAVAEERKKLAERRQHLAFKANEIVRLAMSIEREIGLPPLHGNPPQLEPRQETKIYSDA